MPRRWERLAPCCPSSSIWRTGLSAGCANSRPRWKAATGGELLASRAVSENSVADIFAGLEGFRLEPQFAGAEERVCEPGLKFLKPLQSMQGLKLNVYKLFRHD